MKEIRSETAVERSCTAGADAGGQQAGGADVGVVLESERDRRTYAWLLENFGADAVNRAVASLAGARRPYVSNIAKSLGVSVPREVHSPEQVAAEKQAKEASIQRLRALQQKLRDKLNT